MESRNLLSLPQLTSPCRLLIVDRLSPSDDRQCQKYLPNDCTALWLILWLDSIYLHDLIDSHWVISLVVALSAGDRQLVDLVSRTLVQLHLATPYEIESDVLRAERYTAAST